ncbi:signal recognition particle protein, partial [bacterium M21]
MFDNLTDRLQDTFRDLTGRGSLDEKNIDDAMRQIRLALLDADVNYKIVKEYIAAVRAECLGEKVIRGVKPGEMTKKVVHDHLVKLMGEANVPLDLDGAPASIMMVGLHGSGKTTTTAKLGMHLKSLGKRPLLVAADLYRPAAIDQLEALARDIELPVFANRDTKNIVEVANTARAEARKNGNDVLIFDTAGRLQIAEDLVQELVMAKRILQPNEILLVADAALGQEAVSVASHFDEALGLTGIVLTKLDGDARGGAALSMRQVTGKPIKLIGIGEKMDDLQSFHPDRMADRILGMGDVVSLVENIQQQIDEKDAKKLEEKMLKNKFDFEDFLSQLRQLRKLGGFSSILDYLPGGRNLMKGMDFDESMLTHVEAIIQSMTQKERATPPLLNNANRRHRIAKGSGRPVIEVQQLIKRFEMMRGMMSQFGKMSQYM